MIRTADASFRQIIDCDLSSTPRALWLHTLHSRNALYARELPPAELTIRSANSRVSHASWPCASPLAPPWPTIAWPFQDPAPESSQHRFPTPPPHHALRGRRRKRRISSLDHVSSFCHSF